VVVSKGSVVAGYRIEAVLRRGALGVVYRATQLALDRTVALRLLPGELADDPAFRDRFQREVALQAALDHPHILAVYEAGQSEHGVFLAQQLVIGRTLDELIRGGELDAGRTIRILTQVADALDAAHAAGVIHRGIKPESMLVADGDHAYVSDFGLAAGLTKTGTAAAGLLVETVDYMSPEQIKGERATKESDVYSLAAVLYECLSGVPPYRRESDVAVLYAHVADAVPLLSQERPELPAGLDHVLSMAMAKDPAERFSTATELLLEAERTFARRTRAAVEPPAYPPTAPRDDEPLLDFLREGARDGILPERALALIDAVGPPAADQAAPSAPTRLPPDGWQQAEQPAARDELPPATATAPIPREMPARYRRASSPWLLRLLGIVVPLAAAGAALRWLVGCTVDVQARRDPPDTVDCTVFAPPVVAPDEPLLIQVFAHRPLQATDARALATEFDPGTTRRAFKSLESSIALGAKLAFHLAIPGARIDEPVQSLVWSGRAEAVQFAATVLADVRDPRLIGTVTVTQDSVPIGHVKFLLPVQHDGAAGGPRRPVGDDARRYRSVFLSYASTDRDHVLRGAQMLRSVGIQCFQDILELDPGDRWEHKLYSFIEQSDLFLLFWSDAARDSEWVRKEVAYALRCKQTDLDPPEIKPVILERPPRPPWPEVAHLHFDDRLSYFIAK
jgi:hypothetical protein